MPFFVFHIVEIDAYSLGLNVVIASYQSDGIARCNAFFSLEPAAVRIYLSAFLSRRLDRESQS